MNEMYFMGLLHPLHVKVRKCDAATSPVRGDVSSTHTEASDSFEIIISHDVIYTGDIFEPTALAGRCIAAMFQGARHPGVALAMQERAVGSG
jgi:hypothetical protein